MIFLVESASNSDHRYRIYASQSEDIPRVKHCSHFITFLEVFKLYIYILNVGPPPGQFLKRAQRAAQSGERAAFRYSAFTSLTLVSGGVMGCAPAAPKGVGGGSPEGVTAGRPSSFTPIGVRSLGVVGYVEMMGVVWQSNMKYINIITLYQIMTGILLRLGSSWTVAHLIYVCRGLL